MNFKFLLLNSIYSYFFVLFKFVYPLDVIKSFQVYGIPKLCNGTIKGMIFYFSS